MGIMPPDTRTFNSYVSLTTDLFQNILECKLISDVFSGL